MPLSCCLADRHGRKQTELETENNVTRQITLTLFSYRNVTLGIVECTCGGPLGAVYCVVFIPHNTVICVCMRTMNTIVARFLQSS